MKHGYIKTAAVTPDIRVADIPYNTEQILTCYRQAVGEGAKIIVFPELCVTGYTCGDLFLQDILLEKARQSLKTIVAATKGQDSVVFIGLPIQKENCLFNVAAAIQNGKLLAMIPKIKIPDYGEFNEVRYFAEGNREAEPFSFEGEDIPFGTDILMESGVITGLSIGCEICEDLWSLNPPSTSHVLAGASIIVNLSASNDTVEKDRYRSQLIAQMSSRLVSGYVYASAGEGESTTDLVFGGHNLIAETGKILAASELFSNGIIYGEIDINRIRAERRRLNTFKKDGRKGYCIVNCVIEPVETQLSRSYAAVPFVPSDSIRRKQRCEDVLTLQAMGLKKRMKHTNCKSAVVGISGGLDSTLALLVTAKTFEMLNFDKKDIYAVTMPCFGTTDRTYENACRLIRIMGASFTEVDIKDAVSTHLADIGQGIEKHDTTYENAQARERTQVLMDMANQKNAMVIGTGDMSELALGWATYNGDHMSMYGVNAGVPKTLVRHLVRFYAETCLNEELAEILLDVLDTPVSPELLPPVEGNIAQKTEDLVGPYELHDFYLFYMLRYGFEPDKIYRIAQDSFHGQYDPDTILKWLKTFYKRFFSQQFKRSCLPDGPKIGSVGLSPRGDLRMPSDACARIWLEQLEQI